MPSPYKTKRANALAAQARIQSGKANVRDLQLENFLNTAAGKKKEDYQSRKALVASHSSDPKKEFNRIKARGATSAIGSRVPSMKRKVTADSVKSRTAAAVAKTTGSSKPPMASSASSTGEGGSNRRTTDLYGKTFSDSEQAVSDAAQRRLDIRAETERRRKKN